MRSVGGTSLGGYLQYPYDSRSLLNDIVSAAKRGDLSSLQGLRRSYSKKFDEIINQKDSDGETALTWAAFRGHIDVVEWLIQTCNADVRIKDRRGCDYLSCLNEAIVWCVRNQQIEKIEAIYAKFPALSREEYTTQPSFETEIRQQMRGYAVRGDLAKLQRLRAALPSVFAAMLNFHNHIDKETIVILAARNGYFELVNWLIDTCKADVTQRDSLAYDYVHYLHQKINDWLRSDDFVTLSAIYSRFPDILSAKHSSSRDTEAVILSRMVDYARLGDLEKLQQLQRSCPSWFAMLLNRYDHYTSDTVLTWAAYKGHLEMVTWLIEICKADVLLKDSHGNDYLTCFLLTIEQFIKKNQFERASEIYVKFPELLTLDNNQSKNVEEAVFNKIVEYVKAGNLVGLQQIQRLCPTLFQKVLDQQELITKDTALHMAVKGGYLEVAEWLIKTCKADTSLKNNQGYDYLYILNQSLVRWLNSGRIEKVESLVNKFPDLLHQVHRSRLELETTLWDKMIAFAASGDLNTLKIIKKVFPESFANIVDRQHEISKDTALIWAASGGHIDVVNWLLTVGLANPSIKDVSNNNFTYHLDLAAIAMVRNKEYEKIAKLLEHKEVTFDVLQSDVTAKQLLFTDLIDAAKAGDTKTLRLFKQHRLDEFIGVPDPLLLCDANLFAKAIREGDVDNVNRCASHVLLTNKIGYEKGVMLSAVELAHKYKKNEVMGCLIAAGADLGELSSHYGIADVNLTANRVLVTIDQRIENIGTALSKLDHAEMKESEKDFATFRHECCNLLAMYNQDIIKETDILKKMDWLFLASRLLSSIEKSKTLDELHQALTLLFAEREEYLRGKRLDYCFDLQSPTNKFCHILASKLCADAPHNILLRVASTKDRDQAWFEPTEIDEKQKIILPSPDQFFRTSNDEIHIYEYIVDTAISRMIDEENTLLEHIWVGTDPKCVTPVPPLKAQHLSIMKQRSPALRELIEYTERLDAYSRSHGSKNVLKQFTLLKNGLFNGDYRTTGSHTTAGEAAYAAIASFADWWNALKQKSPQVCDRISSLGHRYGGTTETLGMAIAILFDQSNLNNTLRTDSATYCINIKANMIERILADATVRAELESINIQYLPYNDFNALAATELQALRERINKELKSKASQPSVIISNFGYTFSKENSSNFYRLTSLLIKQGVIRYKDFIDDFYLPHVLINRILQYVLSESDNSFLLELRDILSKSTFDYLREIDRASLGIFNTTYYAHIHGHRAQTNKAYAYLEEMIAAQLVKNSVQEVSDHKQASAKVSELYQQHGFMSIHRKHDYHLKDVNTKYIDIIAKSRSVEEVRQKITDKMEQLKISYR